jgi:uncharacterized protein with ParB-like and HNH nuclease domain
MCHYKTTVLSNNIFVIPNQRAYSWDTNFDIRDLPKQTNVFLEDLEDNIKGSSNLSYYFGHFLFEKKAKYRFAIIDGQQRLTTIVILLSALFKKLESLRPLTENEKISKEDMLDRKSIFFFETVDFQNLRFKDYVMEHTKMNKNGLETQLAIGIVNAFDFFTLQFEDEPESYLMKMLDTIHNAICTTYILNDEFEAIQILNYQSNINKFK